MSPTPATAARKRPGFTLIFVIVITAIMAVLVAVVSATLARYVSTDNAQTTVTILEEIAHADSAYFLATGSATYPNRLGMLDSLVVNGNASYHNSCGTNINGGQAGSINGAVPFNPFKAVHQTKQSVYTPVGWINDTLIRNPASGGGSPAFLETQINGITLEDAQIIDDLVDGTVNAGAGTIEYGAAPAFTNGTASSDTLTLIYKVPITAGKC